MSEARHPSSWFLALSICVCACWRANSASPSPPPAKLFPAIEATLTNGLHLLTLEDHSCPIVAVQVWYHVGGADEPAGRRGFAHLFEHMMFRGTDRLGPTDHFDLLQSVGGNCNAFTSFDETCYHETLPASQLELALWLESERMAFLTVDTAGFNTERKVVEEERRLGLNLPYGDLPDRALPALFGKHPYANNPIGTIRDLRQATASDVHAWWAKWYTPNNATLVIVGDVQPDRVRELVEKYFGWIPPVPQAPKDIPLVPAFENAQQIVLQSENAPAPGVGIVWRTVPEGHPDSHALELLAIILGGGSDAEGIMASGSLLGGSDSSRLYRRLVAEDHLAVVAKAGQFQLARGGAFGAGAVMLPVGGDPARTMTALRDEFDRLLADGVTQQELEKARNQAMSRVVLSAQTVEDEASMIGRATVVGTGLEELNTRLEVLRRLTRQDLQRVARTYLAPEHAMSVTVPGSSLVGQLSRLFLGNRKAEEETPITNSPDTVERGRPGVVRPTELPVRAPIKESQPTVPNPKVIEHHLTNGLRILIAPNSKTPAVRVILALPFGSWSEPKPGVAGMTLTMLPKGTESHDEKALTEELDRYAIGISAFASHDDSRVQATCLAEHAERAFSLLQEIVVHPTFPEAPFKTAVNQTRTELTITEAAPIAVADHEFRRRLYVDHPYARRVSGEVTNLVALHREDLPAFWDQVAQPTQATLIIAGALPPDRALALAEHFFGVWKTDSTKSPTEPKAPPKLNQTHIFLVDWPGAGQSEIRVGGRGLVTGDPEKPVADLVSSYFGGSFGARLMKHIRVAQGATYGIHGGFHASRFAGDFMVGTFTKTPSTAATLKLVLAEIRDLVNQPPTPEELSLHRRSFLGSAAARFETPEQVANQLARISLNHLPLDHVQRTLGVIASTDAPQCQSLARRLVDPDQLLIVVVGDASRIREELKAIAPVTVVERSH